MTALLHPCTLHPSFIDDCPLLRLSLAATVLQAWLYVASEHLQPFVLLLCWSLKHVFSLLQITDAANPRYEVPLEVPPVMKRAENPIYSLDFSRNPFGVLLQRKATGTVL